MNLVDIHNHLAEKPSTIVFNNGSRIEIPKKYDSYRTPMAVGSMVIDTE